MGKNTTYNINFATTNKYSSYLLLIFLLDSIIDIRHFNDFFATINNWYGGF